MPFAIAAHSPTQLKALQKWRAIEAPQMSEGVQQGLGLDA